MSEINDVFEKQIQFQKMHLAVCVCVGTTELLLCVFGNGQTGAGRGGNTHYAGKLRLRVSYDGADGIYYVRFAREI